MKRTGSSSAPAAARATVFTILGTAFIGLAASGELRQVLHPRMHPWTAAAGVLFLLLAAVSVVRDRRDRNDALSYYYVPIFALAAALLFLSMRIPSNAGNATVGSFQPAYPSPPRLRPEERPTEPRKPAEPLTEPIVLPDETYWKVFNRIYDEAPDLKGKKIVVEGFVYRREDFPSRTILVGRNLMWCCAADLSMVGFLSTGPQTASVVGGAWVKAEGILDIVEFDITGEGRPVKIPLIRIDSLRPAPPRKEAETVYP